MTARPLPVVLAGFGLLAAAVSIAATGQKELSAGSWHYALVCLALCIAAVVLYVFVVPSEGPSSARKSIQWLSCIAVIAVAAFFRLAYMREVPSGYCMEVIGQFLEFSGRLIDRGFEYRPIWGYASTLHSYLTALSWKLFGQSILVFRLTSAFYSTLFVAVMFLWLRLIFDWRVGLIGSFFMAVSYYQLWATRCGYHFYLVPLFIVTLFASVTLALRTHKMMYGVFAALSMFLGLHAHWCYSVTPVALALYLGQKFIRERGALRRNMGWLLVMVIVTVLLMSPAFLRIYRDGGNWNKIFGSFSARAFAAPSLEKKYVSNLMYMLLAYSGRKVPYSVFKHEDTFYIPSVAPPVACLAVIGLLYCCLKARRSDGCAILAILFWVHVAALAVTKANHIYAFHLLLYIYSFAALSLMLMWNQARALLPTRRGAAVAGIAVCIFLAFMGWSNYRHFFYERIFFNNLLGPDIAVGRAFMVADDAGALGDSALFIPRGEPGKDFGEELLALSRTVKSYSFIDESGVFSSNTVFFPQAERSDIALFLPGTEYYKRVVLPRLKELYPNLNVREVMTTRPWNARMKGSAYYIVRIPQGDAGAYGGLYGEFYSAPGFQGKRLSSSEGAKSALWHGLLDVPADGFYSFRATSRGQSCGILIDGKEVEAAAHKGLGRGLHEIEIACDTIAAGESGLKLAMAQDGVYHEIPQMRLYNFGSLGRGYFSPYLGAEAAPAVFRWRQSDTIPVRELGFGDDDPCTDACPLGPGRIVAVGRRSAALFRNGAEINRRRLSPAGDHRVRLCPDGTLYIFRRGSREIVQLDEKLDVIDQSSLSTQGIADMAFDGNGFMYVLSENPVRVLKYKLGDFDAPILSFGGGGELMNPVGFVVGSGGKVFVLDRERADVRVFSPGGDVEKEFKIPGIGWETGIAGDEEGNVYIKSREGYSVWNPAGDILLGDGGRDIFVAASGQPFRHGNTRNLSFGPRGSAAILGENHVLVFAREEGAG